MSEKYDGSVHDYVRLPHIHRHPHRVYALLSEVEVLVHEMHAVGIVHRDLTMKNILYRIDTDGALQLALTDFEYALSRTTDHDIFERFMENEQRESLPALRARILKRAGVLL